MSEETPSLHIDSDWKAEAKAEKERLSEQNDTGNEAGSSPGAGAAAGAPGQLPPASMDTMIKMTAQEAIMAMGGMADPRTGQAYMNLDVARFHIEMLTMLKEKTKGNLSEEEDKMLALTVNDLQQLFVRQATAKRESMRS